jgi:hypothetical protein
MKTSALRSLLVVLSNATHLVRSVSVISGVFLVSGVTSSLVGQSIISENWEGYSNGATPTSPWGIYSGSPAGTLGSVTVSNAVSSPFATGGQSVFLDQTSGAGPALSYNFTATTEALSISFDYYLGSGAGVLPTFVLKGSSGAGLQLNLHNTLQESGKTKIVNQTAGAGVGVELLNGVQTQKWYHIEIVTAAATEAADTYSILITPVGGSTTSIGGLAFRNNLTNFTGIEFSWNSTSGGDLYLDNISVASVPEPAQIGLLVGMAAMGVVTWGRRRTRPGLNVTRAC